MKIDNKILSVSLCLVMVLAPALFGWNSWSLYQRVSDLERRMSIAENEITQLMRTRTFTFEWMPWEQSIVSGKLLMKLKFSWDGSISILAEINDNEYNHWDSLMVFFDSHNHGILDIGVRLYADNTSRGAAMLADGTIIEPLMIPTPSPYHTCVFRESVGCAFNISIPYKGMVPLSRDSDLTQIYFLDEADGSVHTDVFHFKGLN